MASDFLYGLVYPDIVFEKRELDLFADLAASGLVLEQAIEHELTLDQARAIFYSRHLSEDFETFLITQTLSPCLLFKIKNLTNLADLLKQLPPAVLEGVYLPVIQVEQDQLQLLYEFSVAKPGNDEQLLKELRHKARAAFEESLIPMSSSFMFGGLALRRYHTAMRIAGFSDKQAFKLTLQHQKFNLQLQLINHVNKDS